MTQLHVTDPLLRSMELPTLSTAGAETVGTSHRRISLRSVDTPTHQESVQTLLCRGNDGAAGLRAEQISLNLFKIQFIILSQWQRKVSKSI